MWAVAAAARVNSYDRPRHAESYPVSVTAEETGACRHVVDLGVLFDDVLKVVLVSVEIIRFVLVKEIPEDLADPCTDESCTG